VLNPQLLPPKEKVSMASRFDASVAAAVAGVDAAVNAVSTYVEHWAYVRAQVALILRRRPPFWCTA